MGSDVSWVHQHLTEACILSDEHAAYLNKRGCKPLRQKELYLKTWSLTSSEVPDPQFRSIFGPRGEKLVGSLVTPFWAGIGKLVGFEARTLPKTIYKYTLQEASWNAHWAGLSPSVMQAIWNGADVWLVEGPYDAYALEWLDPQPVVLGAWTARLTLNQVNFLSRFCRGRVKLVFDNDEPGRNGLNGWVDESGKRHAGVLEKLKYARVQASVIPYVGKDPGVVWENGGKTAIQDQFGIYNF